MPEDKDKIIYILISLCIISEICISGYHAGLEHELWYANDGCKNDIKIDEQTSVEDFKKMLSEAPLATCKTPALKIAGLSLAEINLIMNCMFLLIVLQVRVQWKR